MQKLKKYDIYIYSIILILIEQFLKILVINRIKNKSITIIKDILNFTYCENRGVAFSIGNGHVPLFIVLNIVIIATLIVIYEKNRIKFGRSDKIFFTMVIAGGTSNLIDRVIRGYVIDFIDITPLFNFAIFNVADMLIVIGVIGMLLVNLVGKQNRPFYQKE